MIRIGTRASQLALWQAHHVQKILETQFHQQVEIVKITTKGDIILDRSLMDIGGKGLFLKEIEEQLIAGDIDLAVHSMKDVPFLLPEGLVIPAILARENPFDAFVSLQYQSFESLPLGAKIGTCSLRRVEQLRRHRPDLVFKDLRGNVNTRLQKLDAQEFDAIVLAVAGLKRLGFEKRITQQLALVSAVGQGAIGVECRVDDEKMLSLLQKINNTQTFECVSFERLFMKAVQGDCKTPLGCHVRPGSLPDEFMVSVFYAQPEQDIFFLEELTLAKNQIQPKLEDIAKRLGCF